jgi:hypothetical protein
VTENNILSLKKAIFSHNLIFLQWQRKKKVPLKKPIFLTTEPCGLHQAVFPYPFPWVWATTFVATGYTIQPIPQLTHFNPEDGSSMFNSPQYHKLKI